MAHDLGNQLQVFESALSLIRGALDTAAATALEGIFGHALSAVERAGRMTRAIVDAKSDVATNKCRTSIVERLNSMPELSLLALSSDIVVEHFISDDVPDIFLRPGCFRQRSSEYRGQRAPRGTELRPDSHQRLARSRRA